MPESCLRLNHQNQSLPSVIRISRHPRAAASDCCGFWSDCSSSHDRVSARSSHAMLRSEPPEPVAPLGDQDLPPSEGGRIRLLRLLERLLLEPRSSVGEELPRNVAIGTTRTSRSPR